MRRVKPHTSKRAKASKRKIRLQAKSLLTGLLVSVLGTVIGGLAVWHLIERIQDDRTSEYTLPKAPKNLLEQIRPGVTMQTATQILGPARFIDQNCKVYFFSNLYVQVVTDPEGDRVFSITLMLPAGTGDKFSVYPLEYCLGETTLAEVFDESSKVYTDCSSKFRTGWIENYYGNPGFYNYYSFGIYDGGNEFPVDDSFGVSIDENKIHGDYSRMLVNFVSVSSESDEGWPIFWAYLR